MKILYGNGAIDITIRDFIPISLKMPESAINPGNWKDTFDSSLDQLAAAAVSKKPCKICVIVEDKTRINPQYPLMLKAVYDKLNAILPGVKICLLIAYGTHTAHSEADNIRCYGADNIRKYTLIGHDSKDPAGLKTIGTLSSGLPLKINLTAAESDFIVSFGSVAPHAFAGFTGGRKIILPGISSYENICSNHSKVKQDNVGLGILEKNPIHNEMQEAADLFSPDFSYQIVYNSRRETAGVFFGKLDDAFSRAVRLCREMNTGYIEKEPDIVLASCGGEPYDTSLYFAQRTVTLACQTVRAGGTAVIFGKFPGGIGDEHYERWLSKPLPEVLNLPENEIDVMVHSAYLTAKNRARCKLHFYTDMSAQKAESTGLSLLRSQKDLDNILEPLEKDSRMLFIPNGSSMLISRG